MTMHINNKSVSAHIVIQELHKNADCDNTQKPMTDAILSHFQTYGVMNTRCNNINDKVNPCLERTSQVSWLIFYSLSNMVEERNGIQNTPRQPSGYYPTVK